LQTPKVAFWVHSLETTSRCSFCGPSQPVMSLTELADQFDAVMMQQDSGSRLVESVQHFFDNYLIATQTFTNSLAEAASKERARLEGMAKKDEMNSCWNAWSWFFKQMLVVCRANSAHIEDLNVSVLKALGTYQKQVKTTKPQTEKQIEGCLQMMRDEGTKLKTKMEETRIVFDALQKVKPSKKKKLVLATAKAETAAEDYRGAIRMANEKMDLLRAVKIPAILAQIESDEQLRVTSLAEAMQAFAQSNKKKTAAYATLDSEITEVAQSVHATEDIRRYVTVCQSQRGTGTTKNSVIPTFQYTLRTPPELWSPLLVEKVPEKPADPKKKADKAPVEKEAAPKVSEIFGQPIKEVVSAQRRSHPHLIHLPVPVIVANLIKNLYRGGLELESTFRSEPNPEKMQWLRDQFDSGNFTSDSEPAVELDLLKCWLRELKEPVVPLTLVENAVQIAHMEEEGKSGDIKQRVDQFLGQMPTENREVLVAFLRLVCEAASIESNKIDMPGLATIFGPLLLRLDRPFEAPSPTNRRDDQVKTTKCFVLALAKNLSLSQPAGDSLTTSIAQPLDNLLSRLHPEIIATENAYGHHLHLLNDKYAFSVQQSNIGLTQAELGVLGSNIQLLFTTHSKFLSELTLTAPALIPALMLKHAQLFQIYTDYDTNYETCVLTIDSLTKTKVQFAVLIAEVEAVLSKSKADLPSCLFMPLQRLTQYVLWFREIKKHTPAQHPEVGNVSTVLGKLEAIVNKSNENRKRVNVDSKLMAIQRSVRGLTVPLASPQRTMIKDGHLSIRKGSRTDPVRMYLLSDYLLVASAVGSECIGAISLAKATAVAKQTIVIEEVSDEIPPLVVGAIRYIRNCMAQNVNTTGIFRIEASKDDLQVVRQEFIKTRKFAFDDVHVASNMLKVYLREMPVPLIPFDAYKNFLAVETSRPVEEKIAMYKGLVANLPPANRVTLQYLCNFLNEVASQSAVNLMTPQSLGVVFAPNLLRLETTTTNAQNLLHDAQFTVKVVASLIENYRPIFGAPSHDTSLEVTEEKFTLLFQCTDEAERSQWLKMIQTQITQTTAAAKAAAEKLGADRTAAKRAEEKEVELAKQQEAKKLAEEKEAEAKKEQERLEQEKLEMERDRIDQARRETVMLERLQLSRRDTSLLEAEVEEEEEGANDELAG